MSLIKSHLYCNSCGAKWSVHFKLGDFVGATLIEPNMMGKGKDLLQKEFSPEHWRMIALKNFDIEHRELTKTESMKEIIREKEVIVKIRCSYCKNIYPETENKCPHCGARI